MCGADWRTPASTPIRMPPGPHGNGPEPTPEHDARQFLGRTNISTTSRYLVNIPLGLERALERLERARCRTTASQSVAQPPSAWRRMMTSARGRSVGGRGGCREAELNCRHYDFQALDFAPNPRPCPGRPGFPRTRSSIKTSAGCGRATLLEMRLQAQAKLGALGVVGIVSTLFVVVALAAAMVVAIRVPWARIAVRVASSWIVAIGLLLGWSLRAT